MLNSLKPKKYSKKQLNTEIAYHDLVIHVPLIGLIENKRSMWTQVKNKCKNPQIITPKHYNVRWFYSVFYTNDKSKIKPNPNKIEIISENPEITFCETSEKIEKKTKKFLPHPKIALDKELANPEEFSNLWICLTHKVPTPDLEKKYNFSVLCSAEIGVDSNNNSQFVVILNKKMTLDQLHTQPLDEALTAYWNVQPDFKKNLENLVCTAKKKIALIEEIRQKKIAQKLLEEKVKPTEKEQEQNTQLSEGFKTEFSGKNKSKNSFENIESVAKKPIERWKDSNNSKSNSNNSKSNSNNNTNNNEKSTTEP